MASKPIDLEEFKAKFYEGLTTKELCRYFHKTNERIAQIIKDNNLKRDNVKRGRKPGTKMRKVKTIRAKRKPKSYETVCAICGNPFYAYASPWPYKRTINGSVKDLCKYSCCVKFDKLTEGAKNDAVE